MRCMVLKPYFLNFYTAVKKDDYITPHQCELKQQVLLVRKHDLQNARYILQRSIVVVTKQFQCIRAGFSEEICICFDRQKVKLCADNTLNCIKYLLMHRITFHYTFVLSKGCIMAISLTQRSMVMKS